jgi:serine/threonine protein kinase
MPVAASFVKTVLRSGLFRREQLEEILRTVPEECRSNPTELANHLVKTGHLSRFQARKLLEGKTLGLVLGPFQILAPIGKGGMGTVYLARDTRSQDLVALKVLPPKKARQEERLLARFLREMELCQRVAHPHIAQTYEVGVSHGVYFIAMEFISGRSLYRLVTDDGPLTVPRAARLFAEVASALDHAHCRGVIHRDLKPSNILITTNDHAKVLDLGLALIEGEAPSDHTVVGGQGYVVGTMDYMAPEQIEDATKVDPRSDVYGLGCTLYFALVGQPPFPGGTKTQKIARHRKEEPTPITELNPAVPVEFADLVHRMMAKRPADRFASADELRQALVPWIGSDPGLPVEAPGHAFNQQMALLEAEAANAELMAEAIPVEPSRRPRTHQGPPSAVKLYHLPQASEPAKPSWPDYVLMIGIGALIGLVIATVVVLLIR